jgi:CubicO group peptidase (beta-lactamase class C family)
VRPDSTLFRPGSISKLFVWTAVMQQVEQGKLDLDADVNTYIDFTVPHTFGKPVTLRDLMTHRPGFEETNKDLFVTSASDLHPMGEYLRAHLPRQIYPPGTVPAYSNYGATLAAYIVQRVSHQPFAEYVEDHIFRPLDMRTSTFRQPLPTSLEPLMSSGYARASAGAKGFEFIQVAPAGALSASAADMTHFMIAHLEGGRYEGHDILQPATVTTMHARQTGWPAPVPGMALGFYEESRNGRRIIGHGGDTDYFHSDLHLILDEGVGFFVSYNSEGQDEVPTRSVLFDAFMDRYFPDTTTRAPTVATANEDADRLAGDYESSRRSETNILAATALLGQATVTPNHQDTTITVQGLARLNGQPIHYREVGPLVFRAVDGHEQLAFSTDINGRRVAYSDFPFEILQHVDHWLDRKMVSATILALSVAVMVLTLLGWPVAAMVRRHYEHRLALTPGPRRLRFLVRLTCILDLTFLGLLTYLVNRVANIGSLGAAGDLEIHAVQILGVIGLVGAALSVVTAAAVWRWRQHWVWARVWMTVVGLACIGFAWFIIHWHMLNFDLVY